MSTIENYSVKEVRSHLKYLAQAIRIKKQMRKTVHCPDFSKMNQQLVTFADRSYLYALKDEFRSLHIACCEFRGKTRDQIENKVGEGNEPNETKIAAYKKLIQEYYDSLNLQEAENGR